MAPAADCSHLRDFIFEKRVFFLQFSGKFVALRKYKKVGKYDDTIYQCNYSVHKLARCHTLTMLTSWICEVVLTKGACAWSLQTSVYICVL